MSETEEKGVQADEHTAPDDEWLPSPMDFSNARSRAKPLPTEDD